MLSSGGIASVVLNFDELSDALIAYFKDGINIDLSSVTVDTKTMEQLLGEIRDKIQGIDYTNLINALNNLGAKLDNFASQIGQSGIATIIGEAYDVTATPSCSWDYNIDFEGYLTGITFQQSNQAYNSKDNINISLVASDGTITSLFKSVYFKGFGEYKYLTVFKPLLPGTKIRVDYNNPSQNTKVLWMDFHCIQGSINGNSSNSGGSTPSGGGSSGGTTPTTTASYLGRFVASAGDTDYIDPSTLELDYWTMAAEAVPNNFWQGRNYLLGQLALSASDGSKYNDSKITATNYHNYLFQLHQDIRKHGLVLSDWENDYTSFISKCNITKAMGGYGLMSLSKVQQTQIYLTYTFQTISLVFPCCESLLTADYINCFKTYLDANKLWVLEWIDFNDVNPENSVGAFDLDLGDTGDLKTFRTYMNIEPSALDPATFDSSSDEVLSPFFVRKYISGPLQGDALIQVASWFPGITWEIKKVPSYYIINPNLMAPRVFCHELGHGLDFQYGSINGTKWSDMPEWRNISGWSSGDAHSIPAIQPAKWAQDCTSSDLEPPISLYGCTLVYEDFAETYSCYQINPNYLRDFYPKRYAFMESYVKGFNPYHGNP